MPHFALCFLWEFLRKGRTWYLFLILSPLYGLNYKNHCYALVFLFTMEETNRCSHLLPSLSLGFHLYKAFPSGVRTLESTLVWLPGGGQKIPNYTCQTQIKKVAVTSGSTLAFSVQIGTLLELYKTPEVWAWGAGGRIGRDESFPPRWNCLATQVEQKVGCMFP